MIDLRLLRENPDTIIALLKKKDPLFPAGELAGLDKQVRSLRQEVEALRHQKNELANQAKKGITDELRSQSIAIGKATKEKEAALIRAEERFEELHLGCPNLPDDELPEGGKAANKLVLEVGSKPKFSFEPKHHVELGQALGWFDFETAARVTGNNFVLYKGDAVLLQWALIRMMIENNRSFGYELVDPALLVNETSLLVASNFPKFKDQVYHMQEDSLYMTPTAEVNLVNLYRDHIFGAHELPVRLTAWTKCFRREAGSYGATERGLIRIHQFDKVEIFTFCTPEQVLQEQKRMLECAQVLLKKLGLHYRVMLLAAQDCSFPSAKTYDIEVWLPGQKAYYEVSSVSNCTDFQARRGKIRYRKTPDAKPEYVYTLNGSALALPRLMVALLETYQQKDGTIALPEELRKQLER